MFYTQKHINDISPSHLLWREKSYTTKSQKNVNYFWETRGLNTLIFIFAAFSPDLLCNNTKSHSSFSQKNNNNNKKSYHQISDAWKQRCFSIHDWSLQPEFQTPVYSVGWMHPPFPGCNMCFPADIHEDAHLQKTKKKHFMYLKKM